MTLPLTKRLKWLLPVPIHTVMALRILLYVLAPAGCLLLLASFFAMEARGEALAAKTTAELAELSRRAAALDGALSAETVSGASGANERIREAAVRTDFHLAQLEDSVAAMTVVGPSTERALHRVRTTLRFRDDMTAGLTSPLQIGDRYGAAREELRLAVASEARTRSPELRTSDLSAMLELVNASSAQLDERLAVQLALRYDTWAPGQLAVVVGAIERQRLHLAEASNLRPELELVPDAELERVRTALLTSAELPDLDATMWNALSRSWSLQLEAAIRDHGIEIGERAQEASSDAERSFLMILVFGAVLVLSAVGAAVGLARRRVRELADLEHRADFDALTGLANRARSIREIEAASKRNDPANPPALLFLDLDGFKQINDREGHECGDRVLREVAVGFSRVVDDNVVLGRLGGDEFVCLIPSVGSVSEAVDVAAVLRRAVLAVETAEELALTVSIGLAVHRLAQPHREWLAAADVAMYEAKGSADWLRIAEGESGSGIRHLHPPDLQSVVREAVVSRVP